MNEEKGEGREMEGVRETERTVKRLLTWILDNCTCIPTCNRFPMPYLPKYSIV